MFLRLSWHRYQFSPKGRVTSVQKGSIPNKIGKEGRDEANDFKKKATNWFVYTKDLLLKVGNRKWKIIAVWIRDISMAEWELPLGICFQAFL